MTVGSLFSGIGGLELGLEMCGVGPVLWQAECDPYALAVLEHHWPKVKRYMDVRDIDASAARVDLVCGGFPCQDVSSAGKRAGLSGERSGLWWQFRRIVRVCRPTYVFIENVNSGRRKWLPVVRRSLWKIGYATLPIRVSADDVGAPHERARVFVLAYPNGNEKRLQPWRAGREDRGDSPVPGNDGQAREVANTESIGGALRATTGERSRRSPSSGEPLPDANGRRRWTREQYVLPGQSDSKGSGWWSSEPDVGRVADGVPARTHRLRLLGNAVVPAQAAIAFLTLAARLVRQKEAA